jgi:alkylresorcinol/alkylpyrone synthase
MTHRSPNPGAAGGIASAAVALPEHRYEQDVIAGALQSFWGTKLHNGAALRRLHARAGVSARHLALPIEQYPRLTSWGEANDQWIGLAQELGERAITTALTRAGLAPGDLSALFFTSITGISSPSIDARLVNVMGLAPSIKRVPIFGLGCVAGAAALARAADYVRAFPNEVAAVLAVEICSLTIQRDDVSMANLISSGLFGDGAGAVLVAGSEVSAAGPAVLATRSVFYPNSEHVMGWEVSEGGFKIVLSAELPSFVRTHLGGDVDAFLAECGLTRGDIGSWVLHTGGPKVLDAIAAALDLPDDALAASWDCLREMGNLSSASVIAVLDTVMRDRRPPPGTYGLLAAMGPGFCSEYVLLRW